MLHFTFPDSSLATWHQEQLPPPFNQLAAALLLENVPHADEYLTAAVVVLVTLAIVQLKAFSRPPPVAKKLLPKRPALSIQFKPDDPNIHHHKTSNTNSSTKTNPSGHHGSRDPATSTTTTTASVTSNTAAKLPKNASFIQRIDEMSKRLLFRGETKTGRPAGAAERENDDLSAEVLFGRGASRGQKIVVENVTSFDEQQQDGEDASMSGGGFGRTAGSGTSSCGSGGGGGGGTSAAQQPPPPFPHHPGAQQDLPDSFAPLLSSSHTEFLSHSLTADLIHAVQLEASVRLRPGRHEIPLDKDQSRPQLLLEIPGTGCRLSAVAVVGSDGLSNQEDMEVARATTSRSKPMVKHAGVVLDPPLPLSNVAPTLIHFPTLFEDRHMSTTLRSMQLVRFLVDFIVSISSFLEKCLWILESQCQIHLSKVRIMPIYKGKKQVGAEMGAKSLSSPEWRLQLAFSGHVLLFGWIPIPFISVTLPTFIIPQPHALLDYLISAQPLASARLKRENIAEQRIALAVVNTVETWNTELKAVATPPAIGVDVTLPGGVAIAMEIGLWRDHHAGRNRESNEAGGDRQPPVPVNKTASGMTNTMGDTTMQFDDSGSINSMSSWTTRNDSRRNLNHPYMSNVAQFDANRLVPWMLELSAKGSISHEKMSAHVLKFSVKHDGSLLTTGMIPTQPSQFSTRGSFAVWKLRPGRRPSSDSTKPGSKSPIPRRRKRAASSHPELEIEDSPSVAAILLFPDETNSFHNDLRMLQYDYVFDVSEDSKIDAVTVSVGATHPMLNGGTMITTIFDSIYAFGSCSAREDSVLDPIERRRKRNILRHLPATDFTFGIQNIFIPPESNSYSDDGLSLYLPEIEGGRMMVRFLGGIDVSDAASTGSGGTAAEAVADGIKLVADFEIPSFLVNTESFVKEFPELDISEGVKLRTLLSGVIGGSVKAHLRSQQLTAPHSSMGPNVFNPLEAYEIDFSRSSLSVKMKEFSNELGHRRLLFPAESSFTVQIIESVVDMGFEGKTRCDLSWDFNGLSPILQVTTPGQSPADALPENKVQVSLLVSPLRQGRFSLVVSSVGGISITKAATSREDKEGLYDWKFFNALVSSGEESTTRIMAVLHDKRTVDKLLQIVKVINGDLYTMLRYGIEQFWRAKEILDQEGVSDPGHAIPMYKMARLTSLFLTGDVSLVDEVLPIVRRVVAGDGLDVVKVKDLLRENLEHYESYPSEFDRAVRWAAVAVGPVSATFPYVDDQVIPLAELPQYAVKFGDIPSASQLYETLLDKPQLPLDPSFSNLVGRVAPYLSFRQIEYILEVRASTDWQPADLRRIRYVYSIKRKVLEIAESYGGLSFLPQSFYLSIFLGEATRSSLRASHSQPHRPRGMRKSTSQSSFSIRSDRQGRLVRNSAPSTGSRRSNMSTLTGLRRRRGLTVERSLQQVAESADEEEQTPAERVASYHKFTDGPSGIPESLVLKPENPSTSEDRYELGDSLLGPQDVAILLQSGLTSVMKSSTVVQLNQRMLIDLICSQPREFAVAVLAEIGTTPRSLTSALMSLLELDQTAFKENHKIDMHVLLESWLPELKVPRREEYMAGGRWARQSYYEALFAVAVSISDDGETYKALKSHVQQVRDTIESDPLPHPREETRTDEGMDISESGDSDGSSSSKLSLAIEKATGLITDADEAGRLVLDRLIEDEVATKAHADYSNAIALYQAAFDACAKVQELDKQAFCARWFGEFYKRNYNALMIKSMFDNVMGDVDKVRYWLRALLKGAKQTAKPTVTEAREEGRDQEWIDLPPRLADIPEDVFDNPENVSEQLVIDAILGAVIYDNAERESLRVDPLVRLLIPNAPGHYDFVIVSAAGVITEGKQGLELKDAFERLERERGVKVIRADTATARSIEYNASKVEEAIGIAQDLGKPYGLLGYSQGCANALMAETMLLSGTPKQRQALAKSNGGLVCRQLLFSAANGSFHGPAVEKKVQSLITMSEDFFKSQAGYFSRTFASTVLETLNSILDSSDFHKAMGGANSFLPDGCREFWREAQHLSDVPTCTLRGVLEEHTTPESLEMLSNLLAKQSGSALHDSQVHVFDAVGYPVYHINRNGKLLKRCAIGEGAIQRTHHWSPLNYEVEFVRTAKDIEKASFDCAKDRHVFPWVEVNKRFGFIKLSSTQVVSQLETATSAEFHPSKLVWKNHQYTN